MPETGVKYAKKKKSPLFSNPFKFGYSAGKINLLPITGPFKYNLSSSCRFYRETQ